MKKMILFSLLLASLHPLSGQQLNEQQRVFLDSVQQQYVQAHTFWMEVDVLTFDEEGQPLGEVSTSQCFKQGDHYLVKTPYAIQLLTTDLQLFINHLAQSMILLSVKHPSQPQAIMKIDPPFSEGNWLDGEVIWTESNGIVSLQLIPANEDADLVFLHFDRAEYVLKGVDYYHFNTTGERPYHTRIQYPLVKINQGVGDAQMSMDAYLIQREGEWMPKEGWQLYEFIDETKS
jgi:hypothetical protein